MAGWHQHAVFYELYLRAFRDSNGDGQGDLAGLHEKLDYLQWLGVDCIWLLPLMPSPLRDDGYDVVDYYSIHPDYGSLTDFAALVDAVHARGMRIIVDLVMNHVSDQHPWFVAARRSRQSPYRDYFVWGDDAAGYPEAAIVFPDIKTSNWTYNEATGDYYWHRFYAHQPDLNYDNPRVQAAMEEAFRFWLSLGADGYRLDAVTYLYEREGTSCESLPETHAFLKRMRAVIDAEYPDTIMLAETNQEPRDLLPYFGDSDEMHLCFHFPLMPRLFMAVAQGSGAPVIEILRETPPLPPGCQWAAFLRNHDELTLEKVPTQFREGMRARYLPNPRQTFNGGIARRLASLMDGDRAKIELMHSMLYTLPGTPVMYYGDEIGLGDRADVRGLSTPRGTIAHDARMGVRLPMQWDAAPNGGFTDSDRAYAPIPEGEFGAARVSVAAQMADDGSLLHTVRRMIMARRALPMLADAAFNAIDGAPEASLCFVRAANGERLLALHNLSAASLTITLPAGAWRDAFTDAPLGETVALERYGWRWGVDA